MARPESATGVGDAAADTPVADSGRATSAVAALMTFLTSEKPTRVRAETGDVEQTVAQGMV